MNTKIKKLFSKPKFKIFSAEIMNIDAIHTKSPNKKSYRLPSKSIIFPDANADNIKMIPTNTVNTLAQNSLNVDQKILFE